MRAAQVRTDCSPRQRTQSEVSGSISPERPGLRIKFLKLMDLLRGLPVEELVAPIGSRFELCQTCSLLAPA